jgi:predicted nucleic acid-binding protein
MLLIACILSIPYFSWRLGKYPNLAKKSRLKIYHSKEEFQEYERLKAFGTMKKYIEPGVFLTGISALLFIGLSS